MITLHDQCYHVLSRPPRRVITYVIWCYHARPPCYHKRYLVLSGVIGFPFSRGSGAVRLLSGVVLALYYPDKRCPPPPQALERLLGQVPTPPPQAFERLLGQVPGGSGGEGEGGPSSTQDPPDPPDPPDHPQISPAHPQISQDTYSDTLLRHITPTHYPDTLRRHITPTHYRYKWRLVRG